ncbi:hypothetical protein V6N11_082256 [Hibiscus sabdariffa]|uniref:Uncharacterized protein n=1 Tax=Hibiscus sabdariffa TaxID=183260 RepID=A0ABR2QHJ1_9ROSI
MEFCASLTCTFKYGLVTHALSTALAVLSDFSLTFSLPSHERRFGLCMVNKQESSWMLGPFVIFMDTILGFFVASWTWFYKL